MMNEDRLIDLEIRIARQDDLLDELNQVIYKQQKKIDELESLCAALASQVKQLRQMSDEPSGGHEPPPHY